MQISLVHWVAQVAVDDVVQKGCLNVLREQGRQEVKTYQNQKLAPSICCLRSNLEHLQLRTLHRLSHEGHKVHHG